MILRSWMKFSSRNENNRTTQMGFLETKWLNGFLERRYMNSSGLNRLRYYLHGSGSQTSESRRYAHERQYRRRSVAIGQRKTLGKRRFKQDSPRVLPGMDDQVLIGNAGHGSYGYYWNGTREDFLGPIGNPPEFPEAIDRVRARIAETIGHITIPYKVRNWHSAIERLLKEDQERREKQLNDPYPMSRDKPLFDSPFERRRLRILNSLFFAVAKMNGVNRRSTVENHERFGFPSSSSIFL